jgi:hypothetical protein
MTNKRGQVFSITFCNQILYREYLTPFLLSLALTGNLFANEGVPSIYVGVGGSYNSVRLDESINASANMTSSIGGAFVAGGRTGGEANPFHNTQSSFAPTFQIGYLDCLEDTGCLWGVKFLYEYVGVVADNHDIDSFPHTDLAPFLVDLYTGHLEIESSQTHLNHEFALLAYVAKPLVDSLAYLGLGPALFITQSNLYRAHTYTTVNGIFLDTEGNSNNLTHTKYLWGAAFQLGLTHNIACDWLLDFCYSFAITAKQSHNASTSFENTISGIFNTTGTIDTDARHRLISQGVTCTINKKFAI